MRNNRPLTLENNKPLSLEKIITLIILTIVITLITSVIKYNQILTDQKIHPLFVTEQIIVINTIDNTNSTIKTITFEANVFNYSNKDVDYLLEFTRGDSDWYPYIDIIPKIYTSSVLKINANEHKVVNFTITIDSEDSRLINSNYTYAKVKYYIK